MLLNVYITHECLPALITQIPPDVSLNLELRHGSRHDCNPDITSQKMSGDEVMSSGVNLYCKQRQPASHSSIFVKKLIYKNILIFYFLFSTIIFENKIVFKLTFLVCNLVIFLLVLSSLNHTMGRSGRRFCRGGVRGSGKDTHTSILSTPCHRH